MPYCCNGRLYGIRTATGTAFGSAAGSNGPGLSDWNVPTIDGASGWRSSGQIKTPTSHDAILTCPEGFAAPPHACLERFADVSRAQSSVWFSLYRI